MSQTLGISVRLARRWNLILVMGLRNCKEMSYSIILFVTSKSKIEIDREDT